METKTKVPRLISQIWLGPAMPFEIQRMCQTVRGMHYNPQWLGRWTYILWNDDLLRGLWKDFNTEKWKDSWGSYASLSNYVRLELLYRFGGVYMDCDFECFSSIEPLIVDDAGAAYQDGQRICNAFMYATPGHSWIQRQLADAKQYRGHGAEWGVTLATKHMQPDVYIVPRHLVYPYLWDWPQDQRQIPPDAVLEHKWRKDW